MSALVPRGLNVQKKHGRPSQNAAERNSREIANSWEKANSTSALKRA